MCRVSHFLFTYWPRNVIHGFFFFSIQRIIHRRRQWFSCVDRANSLLEKKTTKACEMSTRTLVGAKLFPYDTVTFFFRHEVRARNRHGKYIYIHTYIPAAKFLDKHDEETGRFVGSLALFVDVSKTAVRSRAGFLNFRSPTIFKNVASKIYLARTQQGRWRRRRQTRSSAPPRGASLDVREESIEESGVA